MDSVLPADWRSVRLADLTTRRVHFDIIGNTDDRAYGVYESRWLALYYPRYAIRNADNHEYFVELK